MTPAPINPGSDPFVLITCEHGGNRTPPPFDALFRGKERLLSTHRGYDPGALEMGRDLARAVGAVYVSATVSRLVVELNRPPGHPAFYSGIMRQTPETLRALARRRFVDPHLRRIEAALAAARDAGRPILHIGSHSFTPVKDGVVRNADIGLLYDPRRGWESAFCRRWRDTLRTLAPQWSVRLNYPYRGDSPGLTTELRKRMPAREYAGIELEVNQKHVRAGGAAWARTRAVVVASLERTLAAAEAEVTLRR